MFAGMFAYQSVDPDQRVQMNFRKEGTAEKGPIDFEIGDTDLGDYTD